jgi:hypothetical protein
VNHAADEQGMCLKLIVWHSPVPPARLSLNRIINHQIVTNMIDGVEALSIQGVRTADLTLQKVARREGRYCRKLQDDPYGALSRSRQPSPTWLLNAAWCTHR